MALFACMKIYLCGEYKKNIIFALVFTIVALIVNYGVLQPWNLLPLEYFVFVQVVVIIFIIF